MHPASLCHKEMPMLHPLITQDDVDTFQRDGVVLIRGLFRVLLKRFKPNFKTEFHG